MDSPDFSTLEVPNSPNYYLVCPADYCPQPPQQESPKYSVSWNELKSAWQLMIKKQPRVTLVQEKDEYQYQYVQRSRLLRFPDYVSVRFIPLSENASTLAIFSRSKYGYSDLGVNKKRTQHWLKQLETEVNQESYKVEVNQ